MGAETSQHGCQGLFWVGIFSVVKDLKLVRGGQPGYCDQPAGLSRLVFGCQGFKVGYRSSTWVQRLASRVVKVGFWLSRF